MVSHCPTPVPKTRNQNPTRNVGTGRISRQLSYALRHGAIKLELAMNSSGYVSLTSLRTTVRQLETLTEDKLRHIVEVDNKNRFDLLTDENDELHVRVNQGHSQAVAELLDPTKLLTPLSVGIIPEVCVHGTTVHAWRSIVKTGLSRMQRDMIHFATGLPGGNEVMSGMRRGSKVLIFIDLAAAIKDGVLFYRSKNGVLLTAGVASSGVLPTKYFEKVIRSDTGEVLMVNGALAQASKEG